MMQYRLSTLFLTFFVAAATMALFGLWGIWIGGVLLLAAICLNRAKDDINGIFLAIVLVLGILGIWFCGAFCTEIGHYYTLRDLGGCLRNYHNSKGHFPPVYSCNENGKPQFSWMVQLLPMISQQVPYAQLRKDEPWNGPNNSKVVNRYSPYHLHNTDSAGDAVTTNFVPVIGPGTIWRKEGTVKLSDLPDGGSRTVALVEVAESNVHWAEPFALTVEEALERLKTGKGIRISSHSSGGVSVIFADGGFPHSFPTKMPLSVWRKLLAGEMTQEELQRASKREPFFDPDAPDMVDVYVGPSEPNLWKIILGVVIWLISIALLFRRAIKSREQQVVVRTTPPTAVATV